MIIGVGITRPPSATGLKFPFSISHRLLRPCRCGPGNEDDRFLNSVLLASPDDDNLRRMLRQFVESTSQDYAVGTLFRLTSPATSSSNPRLSSLALPLYQVLTETAWFQWSPRVVTKVIALLHKQEQHCEAEYLTKETISILNVRGKSALTIFYGQLVEELSKHELRREVLHTCEELRRHLLVGNRPAAWALLFGYQSMIKAMHLLGMPYIIEKLMEEMRELGLKVSAFEHTCLVYGYGKLGLFKEMKRALADMRRDGFAVDRLVTTMVLSSFGAHGQLGEMETWLRKMKDANVKPHMRTFNTVLNNCPKLRALLQDAMEKDEDLPLSLKELLDYLGGDERSLVLCLVESSSLIRQTRIWANLDLHGMHLTTAYLFMLLWLCELRWICKRHSYKLPSEVKVVCGKGSHSVVRFKSPLQELVQKMVVQLDLPLRNDSETIGCFVAKGKILKDWMLSHKGERFDDECFLKESVK
ncbi:unnamed protein product [Cuscuta campestris]|uniref:Smr domain-containing protein n=1 Tax=Cuscuta campestris TaxID=132261 RepID=A0A484MVV0_9ASTE|nr:unnamed protein product [Cuscuta campestris]